MLVDTNRYVPARRAAWDAAQEGSSEGLSGGILRRGGLVRKHLGRGWSQGLLKATMERD